MNEFEAHESSYDHQHKKRLKDMKEMQRQVQTAGRKEEKGPLMTIKLGSATNKPKTGGFKKGGFKNAFGSVDNNIETEKNQTEDSEPSSISKPLTSTAQIEEDDSDMTDQEDYYDPNKPTDCHPNCLGLS